MPHSVMHYTKVSTRSLLKVPLYQTNVLQTDTRYVVSLLEFLYSGSWAGMLGVKDKMTTKKTILTSQMQRRHDAGVFIL